MSCARLASRRKGSSPKRRRAGIGFPLVRRERSSSWETRGMRGVILRRFDVGGNTGAEKLIPQRAQRNGCSQIARRLWSISPPTSYGIYGSRLAGKTTESPRTCRCITARAWKILGSGHRRIRDYDAAPMETQSKVTVLLTSPTRLWRCSNKLQELCG